MPTSHSSTESPKNVQELIPSYLREIEIDQVGLWQIPSALQRHLHISDPTELRTVTLEILRNLLSHSEVVAAEYRKDDDCYHVWEKPIDDIVHIVEKEWLTRGSEPQLGDDLFVLMHKKNLGRRHGNGQTN